MFGVKRQRDDDKASELDPQNKCSSLTILELQKLCQPWETPDPLPESPIDLDHNPFRHPTLTPVDSSDEEATSKKASTHDAPADPPPNVMELPWAPIVTFSNASTNPPTALAGSHELSWFVNSNDMSIPPQSNLPHFVPIQSNSANGAFAAIQRPSPGAVAHDPMNTPKPDPSSEGVAPEYPDYFMRTARLPSPTSDDGNDTSTSSFALSDTDMATYSHSPRWSPTPEFPENPAFLTPVLTRRPTPRAMQLSESAAPKKGAIAMGYRADCEKCRNKVPGHYSHIIRN
ncbi:uncharacterized protein N7484_001974 [Penicillium longicatenatum]|uniref:uncharacterized protein n=1 Tax=Penicillium longicatenatum TaxID=1561947 RepID=UPI0025490541|nr:uncharacterized protein N7484_001974 [Penicillium longicatenatum]KAJ5658325.1 hypothetical protein N7484_001974 [Penicillium longicatenatum]